ncbi:uncharacterized protein A4U43_C08F26610 [Asparagus officinalis]|uniref:uncharacterized protein LOC109822963 n=1 Tax=Asparagus officinalis TaxID=4686 RepID=UPI00098E2451|nr:uncharacterized protein LOC109822963 [Asparagus officinalis]ONK61136.1 uncharacterized protein A4U43_C08F26610 [Asparagus officinalis]
MTEPRGLVSPSISSSTSRSRLTRKEFYFFEVDSRLSKDLPLDLQKLRCKATHISVGVDVCMSYERRLYFSLPRVQHVLHANRTKLPYRMSMCSQRVFLFLEFI